jgi:hypothetical protein
MFGEDEDGRRKESDQVLIHIDTSSGAMRLPTYKEVRRENSGMLRFSWEKKWDELELRCMTHPYEAFHVTENSGRTPLHLSTFNVPCPPKVARALLLANRHMAVVQDKDWYTPLHNVCFFQQGDPLVSLFCDTILMVQCELQGNGQLPSPSGMSPLYLASKRSAPLETLQTLLNTRSKVDWIAPSTGGEPYSNYETLDEYSSPLEILLRDRSATCFEPIRLGGTKSKVSLICRDIARLRLSQRCYRHDNPKKYERLDLHSESLTDSDLKAVHLWEKCVELLQEHCPLLEGPSTCEGEPLSLPFAIVHAIASLKVPVPMLLEVALIIFPEQATARDIKGMIPLHHVMLAKHPYATKTLISHLLSHSPSSLDLPFPNGGSILSQALILGLPESLVYDLLETCSHNSLAIPFDRMLPCCIAVSAGYELELIFRLILASPDVIQLAIR